MMNNYQPKFVVGKAYHELSQTKNAANAWGSWDPEKFSVEDSAFGFVVMENGATIFLEASWALNSLDVKEAKTTLMGSKAGADMNKHHCARGLHHFGIGTGKGFQTRGGSSIGTAVVTLKLSQIVQILT